MSIPQGIGVAEIVGCLVNLNRALQWAEEAINLRLARNTV
jgi:hypothetical protein